MSEKPLHPIGLGLTLFYAVMVMFFYMLIQNAVLQHFIDLRKSGGSTLDDATLIHSLVNDATMVSTGICLGTLSATLFLVLLIRFRKVDIKEHLALHPFAAKDLFNWLIVLIGLSIVTTLIAWLISHETPEFMVKLWNSRDNTLLLLLAILIAAPIFEECLFRGFVFTGVQNSHLGTAAAIVISAAFWTMIHTQYGAFELVTVFIFGIILAVSRVASGSLYVPIALHSANNLFATLEMALFVENVAQ